MDFSLSYKEFTKSLLGKKLQVGSHQAWILGAQGFSRKQNDTGLYRPILELAAGSVYCPRQRNSILFLIACHDGTTPGGCVLVREIEIEGSIFEGPGRVTEALGLAEAKAVGMIVEQEDQLILQIDGIVSPKLQTKRSVKSRLGPVAFEREMPRLILAFRRKKALLPELTFQGMLDECAKNCSDERELRRWLRE